jgi:hypothetical protein
MRTAPKYSASKDNTFYGLTLTVFGMIVLLAAFPDKAWAGGMGHHQHTFQGARLQANPNNAAIAKIPQNPSTKIVQFKNVPNAITQSSMEYYIAVASRVTTSDTKNGIRQLADTLANLKVQNQNKKSWNFESTLPCRHGC